MRQEAREGGKTVPVTFPDCGKIDMLKIEKDVTMHHLSQRHINVSDLFLHKHYLMQLKHEITLPLK